MASTRNMSDRIISGSGRGAGMAVGTGGGVDVGGQKGRETERPRRKGIPLNLMGPPTLCLRRACAREPRSKNCDRCSRAGEGRFTAGSSTARVGRGSRGGRIILRLCDMKPPCCERRRWTVGRRQPQLSGRPWHRKNGLRYGCVEALPGRSMRGPKHH